MGIADHRSRTGRSRPAGGRVAPFDRLSSHESGTALAAGECRHELAEGKRPIALSISSQVSPPDDPIEGQRNRPLATWPDKDELHAAVGRGTPPDASKASTRTFGNRAIDRSRSNDILALFTVTGPQPGKSLCCGSIARHHRGRADRGLGRSDVLGQPLRTSRKEPAASRLANEYRREPNGNPQSRRDFDVPAAGPGGRSAGSYRPVPG